MTNASSYKRRSAEDFDERSRDYDPDDFHGRLAGRVVGLARPPVGGSVLDVATGTGLAAIAGETAESPGGSLAGLAG